MRRSKWRWFGWTAVIALAVGSPACDWFVEDGRPLAGKYVLVRSGFAKLPSSDMPNPSFHLTHTYKERAMGTAFYGSLDRVGWNDSMILARRTVEGHPNLSGWVIISVQDGAVEGPMSDALFEERRSSSPTVSAITLMHPKEAWSGGVYRTVSEQAAPAAQQ